MKLLRPVGPPIFVVVLCGLIVPSLSFLVGRSARAQERIPQWQIDAGGTAKFDVASLKQNVSQGPPHTNVGLSGADEGPPNGGLLSAAGFPLSVYIGFAYKLTPTQVSLLRAGLPTWANSERFDIEARAEGQPTRDQMRLMMQALIADRFKLIAHFETRELPVFAAVLDKPGKTGPQLIHLSIDAPCSTDIAAGKISTAEQAPAKYTGWFTPCGNSGILFVSGRIHAGSENSSIEKIEEFLAVTSFGALDQDRPIIDRTGLTGKFDFTLEFAPDPDGPAKTIPNFHVDVSGPTYLEALKEQLGIRLIPEKGPVNVLVIDHVEQPSPN